MGIQEVRLIAEEYQHKLTAPVAFLFRDLSTGETVSFHGEEPFPTASMYKLYILAELYRKAWAGECSLSDRIPLEDSHRSIGSGVLKNLQNGALLTLRDYAMLMMNLSDNTATNVLFRYLGRDAIQKNVIEALGLSATKCDFDCTELIDRYFDLNGGTVEQLRKENGGKLPSFRNSPYYCCTTEENNQTSCLDAAKMYELLYRGEWVSKDASADILEILKLCLTNRRIPLDLPVTVPVAHKTGTLDRLCVDTGIVYAPGGDYILCLFYNGNLADEAEYEANERGRLGEDFLAELSRQVYEAYHQ